MKQIKRFHWAGRAGRIQNLEFTIQNSLLNPLVKEEMDMKKRWMIILMAVSMVVFGSTAFAGDGVQDKATSQNSLSGAVILANNSQVSFQVDGEALEKFRAEQEEMGQGMLLAVTDGGDSDNCDLLCTIFSYSCNEASSLKPLPTYCVDICNACGCNGCP
jgi:hypothetical protein